jgi:hypothetical protein
MAQVFDITLRDSQYTPALMIEPERFDVAAYEAYEQELLERNLTFMKAASGLLVYRRMRADGAFYHKSKDHHESLALQLGVLEKSKSYKADIANFLEPWYGIGYIASVFGGDYIWHENQAPAVEPLFASSAELLRADPIPLHESKLGKIILERIEYFLDKTQGRVPVSYCDIQAPVNMLSYLMPMNNMCLEVFDDIESLRKAATLVNGLLIEFLQVQKKLIGGALAKPGHGFPSSRVFEGAGESTDNVLMFSDEHFKDIFQGEHERLGDVFGGVVFHSCGNWAEKAPMVRAFRNTIMVDGAFSPATDPSPNKPEDFERVFRNTGIVVNARCVGPADEVFPYFEKLINPEMKVIATTYCQDPEDQKKLYDRLHALLR